MKRLKHPGTVVSLGNHHSSPHHIEVTVAHGKKKKQKKGEAFPSYDDRPTSRLMVPKAHADQFSIGDRVNVGVSGSSTAEPDEDEAAAYRRTVKKIATRGGR